VKIAFSRLDPKIEVVQNLIIYNFALGHILKFQTYFEMEIQSPFCVKIPFFKNIFKSKICENFEYKSCSKNDANHF
jgi:hypothetical protein